MAHPSVLNDNHEFPYRIAERMVMLRDFGIQEHHVRRKAGLEDDLHWALLFTLSPGALCTDLCHLSKALFTTSTWLLTGQDHLLPSEPEEDTIRQTYCQCLETNRACRLSGTPVGPPLANPDCPTHGELSIHPLMHRGKNALVPTPDD